MIYGTYDQKILITPDGNHNRSRSQSYGTRAIIFVCLIFLLEAIAASAPANLPTKVYFRTKTETFNRKYYLALRDGLIWYKENEETTGKQSEWRIFGKTGMPEKAAFDRFGVPSRIVAISADGIHLIALSSSGVFYRGTNLTGDVDHNFEWNDKWGWWAAGGPGLKDEINGPAWSVSDAFPLDLEYYEDGNNNRQNIGLGVAHLYALSPDGQKIYYNDWWLPADWSHQFASPMRGTFKATNLSVSGSTVFVIGENGQMFTRMYDFDISGENPLLTYSYVKTGNTGTTRKLPMPDWFSQPNVVDGKITARITIFQTGKGNAARIIRAEGEKDGKTGFYYKDLFAQQWNFQETGDSIAMPFCRTIDADSFAATANLSDKKLAGFLVKKDTHDTLSVEFLNFNIASPPTEVRILSKGVPILFSDTGVALQFYHSQTLVADIRPKDFWDKGLAANIWGALVIPPEVYTKTSMADQGLMRSFFGNRKVINFIGKATPDFVDMEQISVFQKNPTWVPFFVVPTDEKGLFSEYRLILKSK